MSFSHATSAMTPTSSLSPLPSSPSFSSSPTASSSPIPTPTSSTTPTSPTPSETNPDPNPYLPTPEELAALIWVGGRELSLYEMLYTTTSAEVITAIRYLKRDPKIAAVILALEGSVFGPAFTCRNCKRAKGPCIHIAGAVGKTSLRCSYCAFTGGECEISDGNDGWIRITGDSRSDVLDGMYERGGGAAMTTREMTVTEREEVLCTLFWYLKENEQAGSGGKRSRMPTTTQSTSLQPPRAAKHNPLCHSLSLEPLLPALKPVKRVKKNTPTYNLSASPFSSSTAKASASGNGVTTVDAESGGSPPRKRVKKTVPEARGRTKREKQVGGKREKALAVPARLDVVGQEIAVVAKEAKEVIPPVVLRAKQIRKRFPPSGRFLTIDAPGMDTSGFRLKMSLPYILNPDASPVPSLSGLKSKIQTTAACSVPVKPIEREILTAGPRTRRMQIIESGLVRGAWGTVGVPREEAISMGLIKSEYKGYGRASKSKRENNMTTRNLAPLAPLGAIPRNEEQAYFAVVNVLDDEHSVEARKRVGEDMMMIRAYRSAKESSAVVLGGTEAVLGSIGKGMLNVQSGDNASKRSNDPANGEYNDHDSSGLSHPSYTATKITNAVLHLPSTNHVGGSPSEIFEQSILNPLLSLPSAAIKLSTDSTTAPNIEVSHSLSKPATARVQLGWVLAAMAEAEREGVEWLTRRELSEREVKQERGRRKRKRGADVDGEE